VVTLHNLRDKMRAIWGDLEDIKRDASLKPPESKAFECCIQEFGIPDGLDGWIRMHRMFKTTIQ
jgi:protection of telomeres protein 1